MTSFEVTFQDLCSEYGIPCEDSPEKIVRIEKKGERWVTDLGEDWDPNPQQTANLLASMA